jgi:hypothetical protein
MKKQCHLGLLALLLAASLPLVLRPSPRSTKKGVKEILARPFPSKRSSFLSVTGAFQAAMLQTRTPGGVAVLERCGEQNHFVVRLKGTTLGAALKGIVAADPRYCWTVKEGVVNLVPADGVPPLLDVRVREFRLRGSEDISSAGTLLFALPEVAEAAGKLGLSRAGSGTGLYAIRPGVQHRAARLGLDLRDVTVREALNTIVRANKGGVWIYREAGCGKTRMFEVNFSQ